MADATMTPTTTNYAEARDRARQFERLAELWRHLDDATRTDLLYLAGRLSGEAADDRYPDSVLIALGNLWNRLGERERDTLENCARRGLVFLAVSNADDDLLNAETVEAREHLDALRLVGCTEVVKWIGERRS